MNVHRKIGGHWFTFVSRLRRTKAEAKSVAESYRKKGLLSRVIKSKPGVYEVWREWK